MSEWQLWRLNAAADLIAADRRFPWLAHDHQVVCDLDGFLSFAAKPPPNP